MCCNRINFVRINSVLGSTLNVRVYANWARSHQNSLHVRAVSQIIHQFYNCDIFCDFLFILLHTSHLLRTVSTLKGNNGELFPFRADPFSVLAENVSIPLIIIRKHQCAYCEWIYQKMPPTKFAKKSIFVYRNYFLSIWIPYKSWTSKRKEYAPKGRFTLTQWDGK